MWKFKRLEVDRLKAKRILRTKKEIRAKANFKKYLKKFMMEKQVGQ